MWREMARIIREVRPRFVFVENSPMLTSRGLGAVLGDLASMGFDAKWGVLGAADIGANHQRDRIWIRAKWSGQLPHAQHHRIRWWEQQQESIEKEERRSQVPDSDCLGLDESKTEWDRFCERKVCQNQSDNRSEVRSEIVGCNQFGNEEEISNTQVIGLQGSGKHEQPIDSKTSRQGKADGLIYGRSSDFWATEPNVGRVVDGLASRMDRIKAIGNGQVPLCAATAWRVLK